MDYIIKMNSRFEGVVGGAVKVKAIKNSLAGLPAEPSDQPCAC